MSKQLDIFEEIAEASSFASNGGSRDARGAKVGHLGVSPGLRHAKVVRSAPDSPPAAASPPEAIPESQVAAPAVPRVITTRDELVDLIRRRRDQLGLTHETIDALAGWASGYASKLLAPVPIKQLGELSLQLVLGALALGIARIEFVEDPEQAKCMQSRWTRRKRPKMRTRGALLPESLQQIVPSVIDREDSNVEPEPIVSPESGTG